jgi:hypothetical protein
MCKYNGFFGNDTYVYIMVPIAFPEPTFRVRERNNKDEIFDEVRKQWVVLTPEEWIRQKFISYLHIVCGQSYSMMAIEKQVRVGELSRRFDIVVYNNLGKPLLLVECKAPGIVLGHHTISQVLAYVSALQCPYFFITNGRDTFGWQVQQEQVTALDQFPLA